MTARVQPSSVIDGVVVVEPEIHRDARGLFVESFRHEWVPGAPPMVQGNRADRVANTLVGLHYHLRQADFWYVPEGSVLAVLADLRMSSLSRGATLTVELGPDHHRGVYIPPGVAHGFYARTDATITYLVDHYYDPADELGVAWDDPLLAIEWPTTEPLLSERDRANPRWAAIGSEIIPR